MRDEPLPVDEKLVALRLAAEDRVVVEDETPAALVLLEEHRGRESAQPAADRDEIVRLAGVSGALAFSYAPSRMACAAVMTS